METIGRCEWCGLVDHHLVDGECPACREKTSPYKKLRLGQEVQIKRDGRVFGMIGFISKIVGSKYEVDSKSRRQIGCFDRSELVPFTPVMLGKQHEVA